MKNLLFVLLGIIIIFSSCNYTIVNIKDVIIANEYAYYEGQKDALEGDIRIMKDSTSLNGYRWIKTPYDNGELPIYDPSKSIMEQVSSIPTN